MKTILAACLVFSTGLAALTWPGAAARSASSLELLEATTVTRGTGTPVPEFLTFTAQEGEMTITLLSPAPGSETAATSASVWLDSVLLAAPSDFKQSGTSLQFVCDGGGSHTLTVEVAGQAGSTIEVSAHQDDFGFSDDFSSDPNSSGKWSTIRRAANDTSSEVYWDSSDENVYLTKAVTNTAGYMLADYSLTADCWTAKFDYLAGGGTGADGINLYFYHEIEPTSNRFDGYYFRLDNFQNSWDDSGNHVGLYFGDSSNPGDHTRYAYVDDSRTEDNAWHHVVIEFDQGRVRVYIDDMTTPVIDHTILNFDYSRDGVAFSAQSGAFSNNHIIDNFAIVPR